MEELTESGGSSEHQYDFDGGWLELSVCCFWWEFPCLGDPTWVMQGKEG